MSNTVNIQEHEWEEVTKYLFDNRDVFCGVSFVPISCDKDYQQAPMTAVYTPREMAQMYGDGMPLASGLIVDGLHAFNTLWEACDAVLQEHLTNPTTKQIDWIRRAKQFARRYFNGDVRQMTYCLKDVSNWKLWLDLRREYKEVDYTTMIEERDTTINRDEPACGGGSCELR